MLEELHTDLLDEIQDEKELEEFFHEVNEVTNANRGKFNKIHFILNEFDKNCKTFLRASKTIVIAYIHITF